MRSTTGRKFELYYDAISVSFTTTYVAIFPRRKQFENSAKAVQWMVKEYNLLRKSKDYDKYSAIEMVALRFIRKSGVTDPKVIRSILDKTIDAAT